MTRREPGTPSIEHERTRERRAALPPVVRDLEEHPGEALELPETVTPEDGRKIERNAIAALLIEESLSYSLGSRMAREPYGLVHTRRLENFTIGLSSREPKNRSEYNRALQDKLLVTLEQDLRAVLDAKQKQNDPVYGRFASLMDDQTSPFMFINPGYVTALHSMGGIIEIADELQPNAFTTSLETAKNSYPLLGRLANEHLDVGGKFLASAFAHVEYFVIKTKPGGSTELDLSEIGKQHFQTMRRVLEDDKHLVTTGCPALVRLHKPDGAAKPNAVQRLFKWYLSSYDLIVRQAGMEDR